MASRMTIECPHCQKESVVRPLEHINIDRTPEMREKVQDLSCFRWTCPNCGVHSLVMQPCLYHDMANEFMVWLNEEKPSAAEFEPLEGYQLRWVTDFNSFREKINILENGLDDRAVEIMKYLLLAQLTHDLDVVELLYHERDNVTGDFRFVAVLSDGVEQYVAMPMTVYQNIAADVSERLYLPNREFAKINLDWAREALELLHA